MKSDPMVEMITNRKIIKKGCILQSKYIFGLVLYTSKLCFPVNTLKMIFVTKNSKIDTKIRELCLIMIVVDIILSILGSLNYLRVRTLEGNALGEVSSYVGFISHLSIYLSVMPLTLNILMELFHLISSVILEKFYRNLTKKPIYKEFLP